MPMGFLLLAMGLPYMIIGLGNRDKWGKQVEERPWPSPPHEANKIVLAIVVILGILSLLGLVALILFV